jgi:hypothetical protein
MHAFDGEDLVLGVVDHEHLKMAELGRSVQENGTKRKVLYYASAAIPPTTNTTALRDGWAATVGVPNMAPMEKPS